MYHHHLRAKTTAAAVVTLAGVGRRPMDTPPGPPEKETKQTKEMQQVYIAM
jgi:hypothetical protein